MTIAKKFPSLLAETEIFSQALENECQCLDCQIFLEVCIK